MLCASFSNSLCVGEKYEFSKNIPHARWEIACACAVVCKGPLGHTLHAGALIGFILGRGPSSLHPDKWQACLENCPKNVGVSSPIHLTCS